MHGSILSRTFFKNFAKNASSPSIDAMLSTERLASNAAPVVIPLFLSLGETASPAVYATFDNGLLFYKQLCLGFKQGAYQLPPTWYWLRHQWYLVVRWQ